MAADRRQRAAPLQVLTVTGVGTVIRQAEGGDAQGMADVVTALQRAGVRRSGGDAADMRAQYLEHPDQMSCLVAIDGNGRLLGFQSLKKASPGNPYGAPVGWGIIGTHIRLEATRQGLGTRFFKLTQAAAKSAGLPAIEAGIGTGNAMGLSYYAAMGFESYRKEPGIDFKRLSLGQGA